jgi:hypothetical protein
VFGPDPSAGVEQQAIVDYVDDRLNELAAVYRGRWVYSTFCGKYVID